MKTIGLIGGLSWLSTIDYYRMLNELTNEKLGGVSSAKIILYSVNFEEIKQLTEQGRWDEIEKLMTTIAQNLQAAGADCLLLGANTMHKIADDIQRSISIPLINIAAETAKEIKQQQLQTVALIGTKYTMQFDFYKNKLADQGIMTIIPGVEDIEFINTAIYSEMGKGIFLPATKEKFLAIIGKLAGQGAQGIILGCTEIPILVKQSDCKIPLFDTTKIHSAAAIRFALS
ncbi:aspartate/glutamate racemase family protein [Terrimonas alba]|uniref:aspartate/glutamate racemase family protein n=1 Tax=Terrimonas alba TaxID=3349636 RepID=UPI0035F40DCD